MRLCLVQEAGSYSDTAVSGVDSSVFIGNRELATMQSLLTTLYSLGQMLVTTQRTQGCQYSLVTLLVEMPNLLIQ